MGVTNEELYELIDKLDEKEKESLYKFLRPWSKRKQPTINEVKAYWNMIDQLDPEDIPLSDEEIRQMKSPEEYVAWEELMKECKKDETKD